MSSNILLISCVFPPEPVVSAQLSYDIAEELAIKKNNVIVLSPAPTRPLNFNFKKSEKLSYNFTHTIVNSYTCPQSNSLGRLRESYSFGRACAKYIKKHHQNIDFIYQNSWPLAAQFLIVKKAKTYKIPIVTHVQDIYPESLINKLPTFLKYPLLYVLLPIDRYILKNSQSIICNSDNMKSHLLRTRNLSENKLQVVRNWQNEELFVEFRDNFKNNHKNKAFTFMYLGNVGPVAGVDLLIDAFVKIKLENAQLIIAGSGSKVNELKNKVKVLKQNNIVFMPVPDGKVQEVQDSADVMLLPVKKNGAFSSIPSKLPAYMFSSKPIIASLDSGSETANAILEANCGIVTKPENIELLCEAMREIYHWEEKKRIEKGQNGFEYAIKNLSKKTNLQKVITIIQNIK